MFLPCLVFSVDSPVVSSVTEYDDEPPPPLLLLPPADSLLRDRLPGGSVQTERLGGGRGLRVPGLQSLPLSAPHQDHLAQVSPDWSADSGEECSGLTAPET